jgi:hypothetical protein
MCFGIAVEERLSEVEAPEVEAFNEVNEVVEAATESTPLGSTQIEKEVAEVLILSATFNILAQYKDRMGKAGLHAIARTILSLSLGTPEGEAAFKAAMSQIVEQYFKDAQIEQAAKAEKERELSAIAGR